MRKPSYRFGSDSNSSSRAARCGTTSAKSPLALPIRRPRKQQDVALPLMRIKREAEQLIIRMVGKNLAAQPRTDLAEHGSLGVRKLQPTIQLHLEDAVLEIRI